LEVFLLFAKLGLLSIGGGAALLGEIQREAVGRGWLTPTQFAESYAIGNLTPGPGTIYAVPVGYLAAGGPGAIAAGLGCMRPPAIIGLIVIRRWGQLRGSRWPAAIRDALIPVAIGLSFASAYTIGRVTLTSIGVVAITAGSGLVLWRTSIPTPLVLLACGL